MTRIFSLLTFCLGLVLLSAPAMAQGLFSPRLLVNDRVVTEYEVEQRKLFLQLLRAPGDLDAEAEKQLIEDRLRQEEAAKLKITVTEDQIAEGMSEFAGRASLDTDQFLQAIAQGGVAPETFRDFVQAGMVWREVVRQKFGPRTVVSEAEVDRALALTSQRGAVRVLLSEIVLPATPEFAAQSAALAAQLSKTIKTEAQFAAAARQHSVAGSRGAGGRVDWIPLANLPPQIAPFVLSLGPGQVTPPIPIPNAIALFQLRAIEETGDLPVSEVSVEYAQFLIPGGRSAAALEEAARLRTKVDVCNDLYRFAVDLPEERLSHETRPLAEVPQDVALELAKLDEGESSTNLVRGDALVFLMLCKRTLSVDKLPSRDDLRQQMFNQRLAAYADGYLEELRANASIRYP